MKKKTITLAVNLLVLLILMIIVELVFGAWINPKNVWNHLSIHSGKSEQYHVAHLYNDKTLDSLIQYTRDDYGLRGQSTYNKPGSIDILTLGGSTTNQLYIDDAHTWQEVLEDALQKNGLNYTVSNAGMDGQTSRGNLMCFEYWFPHIPDLKPKYVMIYVGINDLSGFFTGRTPENDELKETWIREIKKQSAIYHLLRKIKGYWIVKNQGLGHSPINFEEYKYTDQGIMDSTFYHTFSTDWIPQFKKRLNMLITKCLEMGAEPIFLTQPSRKYKIDEKGQVTGMQYRPHVYRNNKFIIHNGVDYYHLLKELNQAIYEKAGTSYLVVDFTSLPVFEDHDYYDFFHMTPFGAKKIGEVVAKEFTQWEQQKSQKQNPTDSTIHDR